MRASAMGLGFGLGGVRHASDDGQLRERVGLPRHLVGVSQWGAVGGRSNDGLFVGGRWAETGEGFLGERAGRLVAL